MQAQRVWLGLDLVWGCRAVQLLKEHSVLPCQQDNVCLWHDLTGPVPVWKHPREHPDSPIPGRALSLQSLQHAEVPWLWQL